MADTQENANGISEPEWDAVQYEAALAHLEKLQEQLGNLRGALPSIVAPLGRTNTSKPQLFADIKKAAVGSTTDVQAFRDNWNSEQTQQILARSKTSLQNNQDLSSAGDVPRYGWSDEK